MHEQALALTQATVNGFAYIHSQDARKACTMLISTFITCYGMMLPNDRKICLHAIMLLAKDINDSRFEDGKDFISFIKEKVCGEEPDEKVDIS